MTGQIGASNMGCDPKSNSIDEVDEYIAVIRKGFYYLMGPFGINCLAEAQGAGCRHSEEMYECVYTQYVCMQAGRDAAGLHQPKGGQ